MSSAGKAPKYLFRPIRRRLLFCPPRQFPILIRTTARKLVIIGDGACGKTSLLSVFTLGFFPTVCVHPHQPRYPC